MITHWEGICGVRNKETCLGSKDKPKSLAMMPAAAYFSNSTITHDDTYPQVSIQLSGSVLRIRTFNGLHFVPGSKIL